MIFSISVIIPAYNVERFIEKAIYSALNQVEVEEVIVINDGSSDKTSEIVESLKTTNSRIKIYHHKNEVNLGRSATRNLGIIKATSNYIAFLDADDFYLENRFENDKKILEDNAVDGVYNAVGFHFYREIKTTESKHFKLNTISKKLTPEDLFYGIVKSKYGFLHLNGIIIRKDAFKIIGLMNETLKVTQDTDIIFKMALKCRMLPGDIEKPVALRGIHDDNIFNKGDIYKEYTPKCFESLISWSLKNNIEQNKIDELLDALWIFKFSYNDSLISYIGYWTSFMIKFPKVMFSISSVKYFPVVRLRKALFPFLYKN